MPSPPDAQSYEEAVRANIRARRGHLGLEQESVAARMRELGHSSWYRQTVGSVEKGPRKVSVSELLGLSLALETSISALLAPDTTTPSQQLIAMPNGRKLPARAISTSAGVGMNEGWVRWDGDQVVWPSDRMVALLAEGKDHAQEQRTALDSRPRLPVLSHQEEQHLTEDAQALLLRVVEDLGLPVELTANAREALGVDHGDISAEELADLVRRRLGEAGVRSALEGGIDEDQFEPYIDDDEQPDPQIKPGKIETRGRSRK